MITAHASESKHQHYCKHKIFTNRENGPLAEWESQFSLSLCAEDDDYVRVDYENSRQGIPPMKHHSDTLWSEEEPYSSFPILPETVLLLLSENY